MSSLKRFGDRFKERDNQYPGPDDIPPLLAPSQSTFALHSDSMADHSFVDIELSPFSSPRSEQQREATAPQTPETSPEEPPFPVGPDGLMRLFTPEPGNEFPPPPIQLEWPAPVLYGLERATINNEHYLPRDVMSMKDALEYEPPARPFYITYDPPTWRERIRKAWRYAKEKKWTTDIDPEFHKTGCPGDLANKIEARDPLRERLRRPFRKLFRMLFRRRRDVQTTRPQLSAEGIPSILPVAGCTRVKPTLAPVIKHSAATRKVNLVDKVWNPWVGDFQLFFETKEEQEARAKLVSHRNGLRKLTDQILCKAGRPQVNDWKIGRAPPLSRRRIMKVYGSDVMRNAMSGKEMKSISKVKPRRSEYQLNPKRSRHKLKYSPSGKEQKNISKCKARHSEPEVDPKRSLPELKNSTFRWDSYYREGKAPVSSGGKAQVTENIELSDLPLLPANTGRAHDSAQNRHAPIESTSAVHEDRNDRPGLATASSQSTSPPPNRLPPTAPTHTVQRRRSFDSLHDASDDETEQRAKPQEDGSRCIDGNDPGSTADVSDDEAERQAKPQENVSQDAEDDPGSTADVSNDGSLDGPSYQYDGNNRGTANDESLVEALQNSQVYMDHQDHSSRVSGARGTGAENCEESSSKNSALGHSNGCHSQEDLLAKKQDGDGALQDDIRCTELVPSRSNRVQRVDGTSSDPAPSKIFVNPSRQRRTHWESAGSNLMGLIPAPVPEMTLEEFTAKLKIRQALECGSSVEEDFASERTPESDVRQSAGLNVQGTVSESTLDSASPLNDEAVEGQHQDLHVAFARVMELRGQKPLKRMKGDLQGRLKRHSSVDSLSSKYRLGADRENNIFPKFIRQLRGPEIKEPVTEAEVTKRFLLEKDDKIHQDFAHFTKLQQGRRTPPLSRFPIAKVPSGPGYQYKTKFSATPSGFPVAKSAYDQKQKKSPFPMPPAEQMKARSPKEFQPSTTRRRGTAGADPSQTRFPVRPSQVSPLGYDAAGSPSRQLGQASQHPASASTQMPTTPSVTMRSTKFDRPFEFPAKSPITLADLMESPPQKSLQLDDRAKPRTPLAQAARVEPQSPTPRPSSPQTQSTEGASVEPPGPDLRQSPPRPAPQRPRQNSQTYLQPLLLQALTPGGRGRGRGGKHIPPRRHVAAVGEKGSGGIYGVDGSGDGGNNDERGGGVKKVGEEVQVRRR
jgi:hypothetical protein